MSSLVKLKIAYSRILLVKVAVFKTFTIMWIFAPGGISKKKMSNCFFLKNFPKKNFFALIAPKSYYSNLMVLRRNFLNLFLGLVHNFECVLNLRGVGYKILNIKNFIVIDLGYSHCIKILVPHGIKVNILKGGIQIKGQQFQQFSQFTDIIVKLRKIDIYKGKGFTYLNKNLMLKSVK